MLNPLSEYKKKERLSWPQLQLLTGMPLGTLRWLSARPTPASVKRMTFGMHLRLKATTKVDMLKWFEDNVHVIVTTREETEADLYN